MKVPNAAQLHPLINIGATPEESHQIWVEKLPLLKGYNRVDHAKPGATVLAEHPSARNYYGPMIAMAVQDIGKGRSMAFTSDTTRGWGGDFETLWGEKIDPSGSLTENNCDSRYYRQFWLNAIRWLGAEDFGRTNGPVTLELAKTYCQPGEMVSASVKIGAENQQNIAGLEVLVKLIASENGNVQEVKAEYDSTEKFYRANLIVKEPGDFYRFNRGHIERQSTWSGSAIAFSGKPRCRNGGGTGQS